MLEIPISALSGGFRTRVKLAAMLLRDPNIFILDEPTNHLDFETVEAFGRDLKAFNGTIFFISHDRTFVSMLATQIVEVKDAAVLRYPGNVEWETIHHTFTTDASSWSRESNARYECLEKAIREDEEVWLSLMEKVEELSRKIANI